jgi:GMP synthase (glutamine-hydrolysing)
MTRHVAISTLRSAASVDPLRPVLVVLHQENSTPGRIRNVLRKLGIPLDIRRPRFGDALPETLDQHAGAVIFGGPMSANDRDDYVRREIGWIEVPLREGRPFLGICLGAQMLARHLGANVAPHPQGLTQIGYYPIRPTRAGLALCRNWPTQVYHWHREGFELPRGTTLLVQGDDFPNQAFQLDNAFGLQFHPDVTFQMMCCWTAHGNTDLPGAQPREKHFEGRAVHDAVERAWLEAFLAGWLNQPLHAARATAGQAMPSMLLAEAAE